MARKRITMNKIREILRLNELSLSSRKIALASGVSRPVVSEYLNSFKNSDLPYTEIVKFSDELLFDLFLKNKQKSNEKYLKIQDNFNYYNTELKRTGVTLKLLWEEYIKSNPDGYSRSQFCHHYQSWSKSNKISYHFEHKSGDKTFVDFTGKKILIYDKGTGDSREVEIFIALLASSQLTYVEAVNTQKKEDWIKANTNSFHYFGGSTKAIVPDCLKSAVTKANKYEPDINQSFSDFATHYNTVILPARPYKPKDKALVEGAVKIIYTRIFAQLREEKFYSIEELNRAIKVKLDEHNNTPMQHTKISRREQFNQTEKTHLNPLPSQRYELREFFKLKVQFNYHVFISKDKHYYSVPYRYRSKEVKISYGQGVLEVFYKHERIAIHKLNNSKNRYTTIEEHMPASHKWINGWNPERFISWGESTGCYVKLVIEEILSRAKHPEQAYKVCMGILNLPRNKEITKTRLNKACKRALHFKIFSYKKIKNILDNRLEDFQEPDLFSGILPEHDNVRGSDYYK